MSRRHRRHRVALVAEITLGFETLAAATQNVSEGGVALAVERPLEQGAAVDLTLFLTQDGIEDPDHEPFEAKAKVEWARPGARGTHLCGLSFGGLSDPQRAQLAGFLEAIS